MFKQKLAEEVAGKVSQVMALSPARDIEKNLKAAMSAWLAKLDLVTREEFDVQTRVLADTREKLQALEVRIARLESAPSE
jgi:BMFP domain-containing protein YqiC